MRTLRRTSQFKKDFKRAKRAGKPIAELTEVIGQLQSDNPLPPKRRDHVLVGKFSHTRECHLAPDWLLIYQLDDDQLTLIRLGSHSELFG